MSRCSLVFQNKNSFAALSNKKSSLALLLVPTMTILRWCYWGLPHWIKWIMMTHSTPDCSHIYFSFRVLLKNDRPSWCHPHLPQGQGDSSLLVSFLFSCLCVCQAGECSPTVSLSHWTLKHPRQGPGVCIFASPMPHGAEHTLALSGHFWVHSCPWRPPGALEVIIKWTLTDDKQLPPLSVCVLST